MERRFTYKRDKRVRRLTLIECGVLVVCLLLALFFGSSYLQAWIYSVIIAVTALYVLSIPRYIKVDDENFEIHCLVEMTRIDIRDIASIREVERREYMRGVLPLLGSYGFFGYYGYYFDFRRWETIKVYASELNHLVEIEDIYEQKYLVSCRDAAQLIETTMQAQLARTEED